MEFFSPQEEVVDIYSPLRVLFSCACFNAKMPFLPLGCSLSKQKQMTFARCCVGRPSGAGAWPLRGGEPRGYFSTFGIKKRRLIFAPVIKLTAAEIHGRGNFMDITLQMGECKKTKENRSNQ